MIGCEDHLRNDLYCVGWVVKRYSNQTTRSLVAFRTCVQRAAFCDCCQSPNFHTLDWPARYEARHAWLHGTFGRRVRFITMLQSGRRQARIQPDTIMTCSYWRRFNISAPRCSCVCQHSARDVLVTSHGSANRTLGVNKFIYLFKHRRQKAEATYTPVKSVQ